MGRVSEPMMNAVLECHAHHRAAHEDGHYAVCSVNKSFIGSWLPNSTASPPFPDPLSPLLLLLLLGMAFESGRMSIRVGAN